MTTFLLILSLILTAAGFLLISLALWFTPRSSSSWRIDWRRIPLVVENRHQPDWRVSWVVVRVGLVTWILGLTLLAGVNLWIL